MAITQKEIAEALGVSRQLVNFALNGSGTVSDETRREILDAASRLGYRRNELARAIVTGKSRVIGILTHEDNAERISEHISAMLAGNLDEAAARGYMTKLIRLPFSATQDDLLKIIQSCTTWRLDGTVAVSIKQSVVDMVRNEMKSSQCPIIYMETSSQSMEDDGDTCIATDDESGIRAALEHLFGLGHRKITLLCGPLGSSLTVERNAIFRRVMEELGLPMNRHSIVPSDWGKIAIVEESVHTVLNWPDPPTALLCSGDAAGMLAMRVARRRGLSVPRDISVIGYGDFALAACADPALTTIGQSFHLMGQIAMSRLLDGLENGEPEKALKSTRELIPASLIVRESTAPPPQTPHL